MNSPNTVPFSSHSLKIISAAHSLCKASSDVCEDAFFITERGFGVADGVSGWNDYGFSSSAFSH